jgi:uncharacterized membrane protein YphA (DoxX/SURF4 family)
MDLSQSNSLTWTNTQKILFRFFCCFYIFFIFPFPLENIPFLDKVTEINEKLTSWYYKIFEEYTEMWHAIIVWIGKNILNLSYPITSFSNGSADTTYDYVLLLTYFCLSVIGCILWSLFDQKRVSYNKAFYWLRVLVRFYLGFTLCEYGITKIFHMQMTPLSFYKLTQPYGESSPASLAWNFIGHSKTYSAFTGWAEVISGVLLMFRRTTTIGAFISFFVLINVVALNLCYDIPVKSFSINLTLMSLFLLAPALQNLINLFILHKPIINERFGEVFHKPLYKKTAMTVKYIFILYFGYSTIFQFIEIQKLYGDKAPKPRFYGIYDYASCTVNGDTIQPTLVDTIPWKQIMIEGAGYAVTKTVNDSIYGYYYTVDSLNSSLVFKSEADTTKKNIFKFDLQKDKLKLSGIVNKDSIVIQYKRVNPLFFLME